MQSRYLYCTKKNHIFQKQKRYASEMCVDNTSGNPLVRGGVGMHQRCALITQSIVRERALIDEPWNSCGVREGNTNVSPFISMKEMKEACKVSERKQDGASSRAS